MFRFKLGIAIGYGLGWMVASGKAAELLARFRERQGQGGRGFGASGRGSAPADGSGVYDFSGRAAE